jgi:hypothetical protein
MFVGVSEDWICYLVWGSHGWQHGQVAIVRL